MNETETTPRQKFILNIVNEGEGIKRADIEKKVEALYPASKPTIARDLANLVASKAIKVKGSGRSVIYMPAKASLILRRFDLSQYFTLEIDQRTGAKHTFDFSIFPHLTSLFTKGEVERIERKNRSFTKETSKLGPTIYLKELERFTIELAWKSSKIEGNTYSLLETEMLIKESTEAVGKSKGETTMILNHKRAFESILSGRLDYRQISITKISQLHEVLTQDLSIAKGIREQPVGITGTVYKPIANKWQIIEALESMTRAINNASYPLEKALIAAALISYIQPFSDGNKRTSRMLANAILIAHDYFPLSYRSVDEETYKKALILFYEQGSLHSLKEIFLSQYLFALETYFPTR